MDRLRSLGLISYPGGIQIDINTVPKRTPEGVVDGHKCDHNCLRDFGSGYDCPAASMANRGLKSDFPPTTVLERTILSTAIGIRIANELLLERGHFDRYCEEFKIPSSVSDTIKQILVSNQVQVNLFGGNPEMHSGIFKLVDDLNQKDSDLTFNITTTGKKSITKEGWLQELMESNMASISLSCDDISPALLHQTSAMSNDKLIEEWKLISPLNGAKQKALEAVFTARQLSKEPNGWERPISFNLVLHHGNLPYIEELLSELANQFPNALVNPFPAQSSMEQGEPIFTIEDLDKLENIIDWAIGIHMGTEPPYPLVPRLHYWLMLKASFDTYRHAPQRLLHAMSGYQVWNCYDNIGAARYVQIGASNKPWSAEKQYAGGHLSCYWNPTVTDNSIQIWNNDSQDKVAEYIAGNIGKIAKAHNHPCDGCFMPRLSSLDIYTQEVGMNKEIVPAYLSLRKSHLGF